MLRNYRRSRFGESALVQVTPPINRFLDEELVYPHLRRDDAGDLPDAALIQSYVRAVEDYLGGPEGLLNRCLITQEWKLLLRNFPFKRDYITEDLRVILPLPPFHSLKSIVYTSLEGEEITLNPSDVRTIIHGTEQGAILPISGTWPAVHDVPNSIAITFTTGYGDTAEDIPFNLKVAGLLMVADFYNLREGQGIKKIYSNPAVDRLLAPFKHLS